MSAKEKAREKGQGQGEGQGLGTSGRWLRKLSRRMSGEAQDRGEVVEYLREATLRGVVEGDALPMLEGVLDGQRHPGARHHGAARTDDGAQPR